MEKDKEWFENMPNLTQSEKTIIHQILQKTLIEKLELLPVFGIDIMGDTTERIKTLSKHLKENHEMIFGPQDVGVILMCIKSVRVSTTIFIMSSLSEKVSDWEKDVLDANIYVAVIITIYAKFMVSDYPMIEYLT
jgi:hypothetical protein